MSKGCDNCYYEWFDEKAYPCSLCIRGVKRTDKWMPRMQTDLLVKTPRKSRDSHEKEERSE